MSQTQEIEKLWNELPKDKQILLDEFNKQYPDANVFYNEDDNNKFEEFCNVKKYWETYFFGH